MTGPEHYRAAQVLLKRAEEEIGEDLPYKLQGRAQVHATLALAAATAEAFTPIDHASQMWREVIR